MDNFKSKLKKLRELRSKIILKGHFIKFPTKNYPGRIYGQYSWDETEERCVPNKEFKL